MHVGFITSHFPFLDVKSVGGIGTSIKNLSDELVRLGHTVTVFVYGQDRDENFFEDRISIVTIKNIKFKGFSWFLTRKKIQNRILEEHKKFSIDLIETPDWEGITSFINLPFPVIIRLNGSDTYFCYLDHRKVKWINKFHEKRALKKADGYLSVSKYTADITNFLFDLKNEYTIIPNGINIDNFKREDQLSIEKEGEKSDKTILYFGGIIRKKGLLEIPHYFNIINGNDSNVKLVLIGKDMPDKISGNISTFSLMYPIFSEGARSRVDFLGSVPYQEIKKHIENATVCIFPSFAEALPVSWLEAMAMEKAIVASDIGWSNEIIDSGINGFKVNPKNHEDFANYVLKILQDEELRRRIEIMARKKIVTEFSTTITAKKTIQYYNEIIGKNG